MTQAQAVIETIDKLGGMNLNLGDRNFYSLIHDCAGE